MNLVEMLSEAAEKYAERPAVVHGDRVVSFNRLDEMSSSFGAALCGCGIKKGDRVALLLGNSIDFVIAYFGIVKTGAVAVLLDPKYKSGELISLLEDSRPRAAVCEIESPESPIIQIKERFGIEFLVNVANHAPVHALSFSDLISVPDEGYKPVQLDEGDPAHISYTSGPSFSPRGVVAPHGNLVEEIRISASSFAQDSSDAVIQFALPMHHVIGLTVVMLASIYCGSRLVILNGVSIDNLLSAIERHNITMFMGVPFIHSMVLRKIETEGIRHSIGSLRVCASAGDILPVEIVQNYFRLLNIRLINFYGLTETLGHVTCEPINGPSRPGSVGPALPGWKIVIAGPDSVKSPPGQPGEVIINGPMMSGYYKNPEATAEIIRDGWLHTGDRGMLDEEGYLYMLGLQKDMLICKGQNIFPSDVEHVLCEHGSVAEAAVVGVPDKMRGEVVGAALVLKKGAHCSEGALVKFCLERLANYKVPKYIVFQESLPRSNGGRVDKALVRNLFVGLNRGDKEE
jgi:long-chain acyl-CoA synthetase